VLFIAQLYQVTQGIQLTFIDQCNVILMTLLTSVGVAGIPASGLIGITIVLQTLGLPIESIGVICLVERLLDMVRTAVNVFNDTCGTVIIARTEGEKTAYPNCV
jgi:Na+/H+-dicarboxylate symporter